MKNVLWITGVFPPINCGGGRQVKLAKYLPDYGWNPIVLAFDHSLFRTQMDEELLKDVEHLEVHRTKSGESKLLQKTIPAYLSLLGVKTNWWKTPDVWIRWKKQALKQWWWIEYEQALKEQPIQAIFSSSLPHTCHLVAQELKRETGLPWVADYRDFWTVNREFPSDNVRRVNEEMEESVLRDADWVTIVNECALDLLRNKFPFITGKSSVITPGYDLQDFRALPNAAPQDNGICLLTYTGTTSGGVIEGARAFLGALRAFYNENPDAPLMVRFIGNCGPAEKIATELGLFQVSFAPWVSKQVAFELMKQSDVLLLLVGDTPYGSHTTLGKLYEYLGAGKPIMAVAPNGPTADTVINTRTGTVAPPNDRERIVGDLKYWMNWVNGGGMQLTPCGIEQYDVRKKAEEMAGVLERITG